MVFNPEIKPLEIYHEGSGVKHGIKASWGAENTGPLYNFISCSAAGGFVPLLADEC